MLTFTWLVQRIASLVLSLLIFGAAADLRAVEAAAANQVERQLRADVEALATEIGPRAVFVGDSLARAAAYIAQRLEKQGWKVGRQTYEVSGVICANVFVEHRGRSHPDDIVIIGAHYDSVPGTPGADDNASGVAAMLALAERFREVRMDRTLRFVAFANEEPIYFQTELMGSRVYAKACRARSENIVAMLSLESVGYFSDADDSQKYPFPLSLLYPSTGNFLGVVGNRQSAPLVARVFDLMQGAKTIPVEKAALPGNLQGIGWSDHWAFWQEGYQAVMITDTALFRNPHYHRPTDRPETLDYTRMAQAVEALSRAVSGLTSVATPE
jgi:Zn-dependent M28 family amino/carboxypeptidase